MSTKLDEFKKVIEKVESKDYRIYFYLPDFEKPSGGIRITYRTAKILRDLGYNAIIVHQKEGFSPEWLEDELKTIPTTYLKDSGDQNIPLEVRMEDFFIIPEGFPQVMQNTLEMPAKRIVFCQNWFYVLNALDPGVLWNEFRIFDCISVSEKQSKFLRSIMPFLKVKNVNPGVCQTMFTRPESMLDKKPVIAFIPSRGDGVKGINVIKTFYALYPQFKWVQFKQCTGMSNEEYAETIRECAFFLHMDEMSSWGTAPIEAFNSGTLVAGWDGYGGQEYMDDENTYLAMNGNIFDLARAINDMVSDWVNLSVPAERYVAMSDAADLYSSEREKSSITEVYEKIRLDRIEELNKIAETFPKEEEQDG